MGLTAENIATIQDEIRDKCLLATNLDYVFPSPCEFSDKADFWTVTGAAHETKSARETNIIRALWIDYARFTVSSVEQEPYILTLFFNLVLFHEYSLERLDETDTPDAFDKLILRRHQEHLEALFSLFNQFEDRSDLIDIDDADFTRLQQIDNTQKKVFCPFIPDVLGTQTTLELQVRIQFC